MKISRVVLIMFMLSAVAAGMKAADLEVYNKDTTGSVSGADDMSLYRQSFVPPVVSMDPEAPTEDGDDVYVVFFEPAEDFGWNGNLKKFRFRLMTRGAGDCDRTEPEWVITDAHGEPALDCDGNFKSTAVSFWSSEIDGGTVTLGGAGMLLKKAAGRVETATGPYYDFRNIYTCKDPSASLSLERFYRDRDGEVPDTVSPQDLGISTGDAKADFLARDRIINLVYGYTGDVTDSGGAVYDPAADGNPEKSRDWILGDIIHSQPVVIDYLDEEAHLEYRFIAVGANDGMLHVFAETVDPEQPDAVIDISGRSYKPGDEIWAFIPGEFLPLLAERGDARSHRYFVDGIIRLFRGNTWKTVNTVSDERPAGEYFDKTLVFGLRRGGRSYWALDVSQPDPAKWSVKWRITGGEGENDFSPDLGYTWSGPAFGTLKTGDAETMNVVVFGGGYDPEEDYYPEPWYDGNHNGKYDMYDSADVFDVQNADHDVNGNDTHDTFNPDQNEMGRGIFVVDLEEGASVFSVTFTLDATTGTGYTRSDMTWCFPAEPTVINTDDTLVIYITDIYGRVWKASHDYYRKEDPWAVNRIFQANPGSDQPDAQTALSVQPSPDTLDAGRKTFYSPDISFSGNEWTDAPVLYFGTGDRVHPNYVPEYHNRFYVISDTDEPGLETDLINLTCDELDRYADANQNKILEYGDGNGRDDVLIQQGLTMILYGETPYPEPGGICRGWYRILGKQGACSQDMLTDHSGEMSLSPPVLFNGIVYFVTYQPVVTGSGNTQGNSFIYALDYSTGSAVIDFTGINVPEALSDEGTLADTYQLLEGVGILSDIRVILKGGMASAFVSGGSGIFPVGEGDGLGRGRLSSVPAITGGVGQLLWEVY